MIILQVYTSLPSKKFYYRLKGENNTLPYFKIDKVPGIKS